MPKIGVLLLNIGSPVSYEVPDVKKYLKTFLMDKDIISIPFFIRWPLVHGIIVPRRGPYSAANYKKIWIEGEGSPLTVYTQRFAMQLQKDLGDDYVVKVGMRYSDPGIAQALREFAESSVESLILAPLYPQYAEATTGSSIKEVERLMSHMGLQAPVTTLAPFYAHKAFVEPTARVIRETLKSKKVDHYLFSFHGLPESQVRKVPGCLTSPDCCFEKNACAKKCYRAQCYASAAAIAKTLEIPTSHWSVSFQSRLGRGEWLKPATDDSIEMLAESGKANIAVVCPSFVADCIETLEEIGLGGSELFKEKGGQDYILVPCLNDSLDWTHNFAQIIKETKTH